MARTLSVNENNDIHAINGTLQIATGLQAVLQTCERVMKAVLGEMPYAQTRGVNYFTSVYGASPSVISFEASARSQLILVTNVVSIDEFTAEIRDNEMIYTATIRTTFGTGDI